MISDIVAFLTDPVSLASLLAAIGAAAAVYSIVAPMFLGDQLGARLKAVAQRREELRRKSRQALGQAPQLRQTPEGAMHQWVQRLNLATALADETIQTKLIQAGLRGQRPVSTFYFFRFVLPFAFALSALAYVSVMGDQLKLTMPVRMLIVVSAAALGYYGPNIYVSNLIAKRRESIMGAFPDALDMMLICVESGMSIDLALQRVSQEIGTASMELAEELSLACAELSYLSDRRLAFENLAKRTDHPGVRSVAMALTQAERYGTPLGQALRVMAKENREIRLTTAEKKAAALPAKLTVPMIMFFLPVLFAVILSPAIIQIMSMPK